MRSRRGWLVLAAVLGGIAVSLDALGAHGLESWLESQTDIPPETRASRLEVFELAARYQLIHAVALLAVTATRLQLGSIYRWAWIAGIVLFCGCLYGYGVTGNRTFVQPVPVGGVSLIVGWFALAWAVWRHCK